MALLPRIRPIALAAALLAFALPAAALDRLGVVAVADPPSGPDAELAELAHQLRAACRDRAGGVEEVATMRARLVDQRSSVTLTELERAYGGALAAYRNGEFAGAIRALQAIVEDLEGLPETDAAYAQWVRAQLRLAQAALTVGRDREADEAMSALARTDASIQPEPDQYSPSYRRRFEQAKGKARALPMRRLQVSAEGAAGGTVFVNGRAMGSAPLAVWLPAGVYRVGGSSGSFHVPSVRVDLRTKDGVAVLDFALAEALRPDAGPGLAFAPGHRDAGVLRAGAWLGVDHVIAVSRLADGDARLLLGSLHDVRIGVLRREGSVRLVAGGVPSASIGALAAFLLTGRPSRDVNDRTAAARDRAAGVGAMPGGPQGLSLVAAGVQPERTPGSLALDPRSIAPPLVPPGDGASRPADRRRWMRPAAYGSALLVGLFTGLALHQGLAARSASADADGMIAPDGVLAAGSDLTRYQDLRSEARSASRNAYVSGGAALVFALTSGVLGWKSRLPDPAPSLALRF